MKCLWRGSCSLHCFKHEQSNCKTMQKLWNCILLKLPLDMWTKSIILHIYLQLAHPTSSTWTGRYVLDTITCWSRVILCNALSESWAFAPHFIFHSLHYSPPRWLPKPPHLCNGRRADKSHTLQLHYPPHGLIYIAIHFTTFYNLSLWQRS